MIGRVKGYLQIPDDYEGNRYSLSWSPSGEAIERPDGSTVVFARELADFLEGYASVGRLIHFSHILYAFQRFEPRQVEPEEPGLPTTGPGRELVQRSDSLAIAFRTAGRPVRNAGALCAHLCRDVPPDPDPPDPLELCLRLANGTLMSELSVQRVATSPLGAGAGSPGLGALDFEMRFLNALKALTAAEVASWLKHGRPPLPEVGERIARDVVALKPRTLEGVIAAIEALERMGGAVPLVAQLVSALSLPPRRLAHEALPIGGYADIATRGKPEQILPSQFAIDDLEFIRRFAGNELLFFHREEPHTPLTEQLVVLLDQGVRTWGRVRFALAASALAFARLASRKQLGLLVAGTSNAGVLLDPLLAPLDDLAALWEASDLTANPSLALERVLETPGATRRDVIVLSHPRSVAEPDFAAATRRASGGTRVFSVAVDEPGRVEFREWKRGVALKVGDFRVDFSGPTDRKAKPPDAPGPDPRGWSGDVEPIPFPFRFGVTYRIDKPLFDFDHAGRRLLLCTHRGLLHAWTVDGTRAEILPRAFVDGSVLEAVEAVVGVADGFVVGGRLGKSLVAIHYDFATRTARVQVFDPRVNPAQTWLYSRPAHLFAVVGDSGAHQAWDLSTGEFVPDREPGKPPPTQALRADALVESCTLAPPRLPVVDDGTIPREDRFVRLDRATGTVHVVGVTPPWAPFSPLADGRPMLRRTWLEQGQLAGNVLALAVTGPEPRPTPPTRLCLFEGVVGTGGATLGVAAREFPIPPRQGGFILSGDGELVARQAGDRQLEVHETSGHGQPVFVTPKGKNHNDPKVMLGTYGMTIHVGKHVSLIRWDRDRLTISTVHEGSTRSEFDIMTWPIDRPAMKSTPLPESLAYDPHRFVACARSSLTAVVDVFGQVALFDRDDKLVAMFLAFRNQVAGWIPDGTRFGPRQGPSALLDGLPTPKAHEIIGRALKAATEARDPRPKSAP